ncbi:MAG: PQQ-binding-like beta-propeller repeat protein [Opitutaceae bacterium]
MTPRLAPFALAPLTILLASGARAAAGRDWPEYLGDPERSHYSSLAQINTSNVGQLRVAWEFHSGDFGQVQCNPIVVGGVLYGATATSQIFALDAATGRQLWRFSDPRNVNEYDNDRGVTYWPGGASPRVLCTIGPWLYALDAGSGAMIPDFGVDGRVSLKVGLGPQAQEKFVVSTTPGTLFGDLLIMPTRVGEDQDAAPGYIQAFNVRTGTLGWVFRTMPFPGDRGYETWSKDAYKNIDVGSANCWAGMAIDRKRGILYVPTGSAAPDFWGGHRLGQDLYADCLLALEAATGRLLWCRQLVHHDIWDRDCPSPPALLTVRHAGRAVEAVAQTTKTGFVFLFDRLTGEPLFPIEEKPFPKSSLDGEQAWPTQPVPARPAPYARQALGADDISPYAENRDALLAQLRAARTGLFQPFGKDDTILFPGFDGGGEWGGPAVDPDGVLYVNANEMAWIASVSDAPKEADLAKMGAGQRLYTVYCATCHGPERKGLPAGGIPSLVGVGSRLARPEVLNLVSTGRRMMPGFTTLSQSDREAVVGYLFGDEKAPEGAGAPEAAAGAPPRNPYRFNGYNRFVDSRGHPAITPPWGSLTAIDLNTGEQVWRVTLGEFRDLTARGIAPTGCENYGGPVATAGGLLFIAATKDGMFRAFDKRSGRLLWKVDLPAGGFATPSTYEVAGRQYVVVACGGAKLDTPKGDSYVAFALP